MSQYAIAGLICFFGGLINGVTGFGALIIMVPLLIHFMDMSTAIPMGVLCCIAMQARGAAVNHAHVHKSSLLRLLLGSLPGIWLGSALLSRIPDLWMRLALGILFICYSLWNLLGRYVPPKHPPALHWAYAAGFFSGALSGAFGINGPPAVIYATRTGWPIAVFRGTLNVAFMLMFLFVAVAHFFQGLLTAEVLRLTLLALPLCLAGNLCGVRLTAGLLQAQYMRLVFLLILIMGLSLCLPALRLWLG